MAEVLWIRFYIDMFDKRKIKKLRRLPAGNDILLIWVMLLAMAGKCNAGGLIFITEKIPFTEEDLAEELDFEVNTIRLALQAFENFDMITITDGGYINITGWQEHQNFDGLEKIREQNRERKRLQRARQKEMSKEMSRDNAVTSHTQVTHSHAIEVEEEKEKEEEKEADVVVCEAETESSFVLMGGTLGKGVVLLTQQQQDELLDKLGFDAFNHYVEKLANFIIEKDAKVSNHYATILKWAREDAKV